MLDIRNAHPGRGTARPWVYSQHRLSEWRDGTQEPLDRPRRRSPDIQRPEHTPQAGAERDDQAREADNGASNRASQTAAWMEVGSRDLWREAGSTEEEGDGHAADALDEFAIKPSIPKETTEDGHSKKTEGSHSSQSRAPETESSPIVIDAHIAVPLLASGSPSHADTKSPSGETDSGRQEVPSATGGVDSREKLAHGALVDLGMVDFFNKLAVDVGRKTEQTRSSKEPPSTSTGLTTALEVLLNLTLDFLKLYRRLVRRFEDQTQTLASWAGAATLDVLWADMVKSFCERSMGEAAFCDGAIMIACCQKALMNAVAKARDSSAGTANDYKMECQLRVAKKCIVYCEGIVELAKRAERERVACQQLVLELKDVRDLLQKWVGR